jgi:hypothetical protein
MVALLSRLQADVAAAASVESRRAATAKLTAAQMERIALARTRDKGATRTEEVQAFALGDGLRLAALPGEVFFETSEDIRKRAGGDVLVVCYANDYPGYFCRPEAFAQGGYEAGVTPFAPEADALLTEAALRALERVA